MPDKQTKYTYKKRGRPPNAAQPLKPPPGVKVDPPEDVTKSILDYTAPTYDMIDSLAAGDLSKILEVFDALEVEKRITLLSRLIIENTLWKSEGMTKKERADLALKAIVTFEGSKESLWVRDEKDRRMPKSVEELEKEEKAAKTRLLSLLETEKRTKRRKSKVIDAALDLAEVQNTPLNGDDAA